MSKTINIIIVLVILIGVVLVLGKLGFGRNNAPNSGTELLPETVVTTFQEELSRRALSRGPHPVEGFDAVILLDTFPGLTEADFTDVATGAGGPEGAGQEGIHSYQNDELTWERVAEQPITSAERSISSTGYNTLLQNLATRLAMPLENPADAIAIADAIDIPADLATHIADKNGLIVVYSPKPLTAVTSPLTVRGVARGPWFFEANFSLILVDWDGRIIAESYATAMLNPDDPESTWMTEEFVPFEGIIEFDNPAFPESDEDHFSRRGAIIFQKANPSDLSENDDALEIPIRFVTAEDLI